MSGSNFIVPARTWDSIEARAEQWRAALALQEEPFFPVMDVLEKVLDNRLKMVRIDVEDRLTMGAAEGFTDPNGQFIMFREDVYLAACKNEARARFTAAHEFGHFDLHTRMRANSASALSASWSTSRSHPISALVRQGRDYLGRTVLPFPQSQGNHL